jgi:proline iminopeptidase
MRHVVVLALLALQGACGAAPPPPPARGGRLAIAPGVGLHYRIIGSGADTAIVLHGGPGLQSSYLTTVLDPLARRSWALIYYDQRGRGQSDIITDSLALTAAHDVEDLDSLRRAFGLSRVTLIAHHWGAILAALYAKRYPEHVKRLLLVSPSFPQASYLFWAATRFRPGDLTTSYLAARTTGADTLDPLAFCTKYWGFLFSPTPVVLPELVHDFANGMCDAPPAALRESWRVNRLVASSLHGLNLRDTLAALSVPVLVIQGLADTATMASARAWVDWTPAARELVLPGPGLFPWRGSEYRFEHAAADFLDGVTK